jgi:hypothetical protein
MCSWRFGLGRVVFLACVWHRLEAASTSKRVRKDRLKAEVGHIEPTTNGRFMTQSGISLQPKIAMNPGFRVD